MKKLGKILFVLSCLMIFTATAFAEFRTIKDDPWFNFGRDSGGLSMANTKVFEAEREPVKIRIKELVFKDKKYAIMAFVNKEKVFEKETYDGIAWKVTEVKDSDSKRSFYLINTQYGNDYVMGFDRENLKWQVYIDTSRLENPDHGIPDISVRDGRLLVQYKSLIERDYAYSYEVYWDDDDHWMACDRLGYLET